MHGDSPHDLLADEVSVIAVSPSHVVAPAPLDVPNLHLEKVGLFVLFNVDIDGEMCIDISHLVLVSLGHADDEIVDEGPHCAEGCDIFPGAVVQLDVDDVLLWVREGD